MSHAVATAEGQQNSSFTEPFDHLVASIPGGNYSQPFDHGVNAFPDGWSEPFDHEVSTSPGIAAGPVFDHFAEIGTGLAAGPVFDHNAQAFPGIAAGPVFDHDAEAILPTIGTGQSIPVSFLADGIPPLLIPLDPDTQVEEDVRVPPVRQYVDFLSPNVYPVEGDQLGRPAGGGRGF